MSIPKVLALAYCFIKAKRRIGCIISSHHHKRKENTLRGYKLRKSPNLFRIYSNGSRRLRENICSLKETLKESLLIITIRFLAIGANYGASCNDDYDVKDFHNNKRFSANLEEIRRIIQVFDDKFSYCCGIPDKNK